MKIISDWFNSKSNFGFVSMNIKNDKITVQKQNTHKLAIFTYVLVGAMIILVFGAHLIQMFN